VVQTHDLIGLTLIFRLSKTYCCSYSIAETMLMIRVLNLLRNVKFRIDVRQQHNQKIIYNSFCTELRVECKKTQGEDKPGNVHDKSLLGTGNGCI
jgi:hypothetical protein